MLEYLDVYLWGQKAGTLVSSKRGYGQQVCYYFDAEFVKKGIDIAPSRAPIDGVAAKRAMPVYPESGKEFGGLPSFIADSLPDHWGNVLFTEWAKSRHIRLHDITPLDRLAYIGRRGMGAFEFVPPSFSELETPFKVEVAELSQLAQMALSEAQNFHAIINSGLAIESLFKVGTSAGGRRPKAVINVNPLSGQCYSGQVPAPFPGFVPMIIKFDEHTEIPSTRIEYSYYLMATAADMKMMPSKLLEGKLETHFLTERFDRKGDEKIHVQTLAAMNPLASSYEDLFEVAISIGVVPSEVKQLFLQMVMNVVGGNVDDHNKNFSFIMGKDGAWHISPAYDYTFTIDLSGPFYVNRHSLTLNGKCQDISKKDLLEIAARFDVKDASSIVNKAVDAVSSYRKYAISAGVPEPWIKRIEEEIGRLSNL
ncbi:MAG: type II toxin-antitoxin system HipA family toxin [Lachnoclostridium sp.]|nr:type II toxin-antitoxin system HipA family toxin [Lachnoclostridium sp.]